MSYHCQYCNSEKENELGICPNCARFPNNHLQKNDHDLPYGITISNWNESTPATRFLVFYNSTHFSQGGMNDFKGSFSTLEQAIEKCDREALIDNDKSFADHWCHIFDLIENKLVYQKQ